MNIFRSLRSKIIEKGYARTTLDDIARGADMSPSHLLYYFDGKEDVLEQYFQYVADRFLTRVKNLANSPSSNQLKEFMEIWFKGVTKDEIGFMLECFGAAVKNKTLHSIKANFEKDCKAVLEKIFSASNNVTPIKANIDVAQATYSLMIGLRSSVYFEDIELEEARRLFLSTVQKLT